MSDLRTYVVLDSLQPQVASFVATIAQGFLPVPYQASLWIEIAPGMDINRITDIALKSTQVQPGLMVVERAFGLLEVHSEEQAQVRACGVAILDALGLEEPQRHKPRVVTSTLIKNVDHYQTQLINRMRHGNMLIPGDTLLVMETEPAGYAAFAANEAEKAARINILEVRAVGAFGRIYIGGDEAEVLEAHAACETALNGLTGRKPESRMPESR